MMIVVTEQTFTIIGLKTKKCVVKIFQIPIAKKINFIIFIHNIATNWHNGIRSE